MAVVISAIPKDLQRPPGHLHDINLPLAMARLKRQVIRHELASLPFIAGADFSFNEDGREQKRFASHWQMHLWIYVMADEFELEPKGLKRFFPTDITVPKPIMMKPVTDEIEAVSYLWKSVFCRRVTYVDSTGRLNTRKVPLKPDQDRELRVYLDQYAATDRLCMSGLQRRGCRYERVGQFAD